MKLNPNIHRTHGRDGVAMVVVLALLALILVFVAANLRALHSLKRDLKIVEQQQIKRLNIRMASAQPGGSPDTAAQTNATPPAAALDSRASE
ncbi:MAG: hypothetical protein KIS67_01270 [Verrucomicrobiae bacterium]|nr:hypothetical protein [Verrucomicrobiae bacterium]